jgi:NifU-like protein
MSHRKFLNSIPWAHYSRKLAQKIERPRHVGVFTPQDAELQQMRLAVGIEGDRTEGNLIALYLLVDESNGVIRDAKFQVFGHSALIGAAETACELLIGKNYDQAQRFTVDLLDQQVRDREGLLAFPSETSGYLNLVLGAIEHAAQVCQGIPLAEHYVPTPVGGDPLASTGPYPGWKTLSLEQKLSVIEEVIAQDIRPYIELDAGGIRILSLVDDRELTIAYEGACTSCYSATGATLDAVQNILRAKVDPELTVIPDSSFLNF